MRSRKVSEMHKREYLPKIGVYIKKDYKGAVRNFCWQWRVS